MFLCGLAASNGADDGCRLQQMWYGRLFSPYPSCTAGMFSVGRRLCDMCVYIYVHT